ncbi:hypothetical protein QBC46DRAFT_358792 [Diplogelasinospora grovesii]|uniref:CENP-V/GFA domain-containing protein n=1 Tax=Diplogelasinospora grovesii TaxID=303347 RepID=A0AAN6MWG5_9PEZI|nr:hypothetical protein QBC46DRAFT_358792 [Diplogelasinospora grovesii]
MGSTDVKTLTAQCYCKSVHFTITVPTTSLPLGVHLCHCHICRYTHGTLCIFHAPLPAGVFPQFISPSSLDTSLTGYVHTEGAAAERFFCSTCGCHVGDRDLSPNPETGEVGWRVATSIFSEHGEDVFQIRTHCFTTSAGGSGLYDWLPNMGDRKLQVFNPDPDTSAHFTIPRPPKPKQEFDQNGKERLRAECHCGGVSFTMPRPNNIPGVENDELTKGFTSPVDKTKWGGCVDLCDDCRLVDGTHVLGWTFVPRSQIQPPVSIDFKGFGTLKPYVSSKGTLRAFCGKCGATVFFSCDDRTPSDEKQVVDVAVGILRAPEGIAAENWITWRTGRLGWTDSGRRFDPVFTESLEKGLKERIANVNYNLSQFVWDREVLPITLPRRTVTRRRPATTVTGPPTTVTGPATTVTVTATITANTGEDPQVVAAREVAAAIRDHESPTKVD